MNAIDTLKSIHGTTNIEFLGEVFKIDCAVVSFDAERKVIGIAHRDQVTVHWDAKLRCNVVTPQSVAQWHGLELPFTATAAQLVHAIETVSIRGLAS